MLASTLSKGKVQTTRTSCEVDALLCREAESACAEQRALAGTAHAAMQARATAEAAAVAEAAALQARLSAVAADLTRMHAAAEAAAVERDALLVALQVRPQRGCCCWRHATGAPSIFRVIFVPCWTLLRCACSSPMLLVELRSATCTGKTKAYT